MAKFIKFGVDVTEIDKGVRNQWKWHWLEEMSDETKGGFQHKMWCKKIDSPATCFCTLCNKSINYGSGGKKALKKHSEMEEHVSRARAASISSKIDIETKNQLSMQDSCAEIKAVIGLFLSEHCLPFTLGPELLSLAQRLNTNHSALKVTHLSKTSATYTTTHGVAASIKRSISSKLENTFFSINIDEATANSGSKYVNILAQQYDEEEKRCVIDLLGSREVNQATASNLLDAITSVLDERGLRWEQVVSVLSDNCNVMRGVKEGVEAKIRGINKNLLDVSGDTVHMVNNAAKKLFQDMEKNFFSVQSLLSDLFYDIEDSPKVKSLFGEIQMMLHKKKLSLLRPIPTRFLQLKCVTDRIMQLWDGLSLYYSAFLKDSEKEKKKIQDTIFLKYDVDVDTRQKIMDILKGQAKQAKSDASCDRKVRILNGLFDNEIKARLCIQLQRGILKRFEGFVKIFQSSKPMSHSLHVEMFRLVQSFYSFFLKPDSIPQYSVNQLQQVDYKDERNQLKDRQLCVGEYCLPELMLCLRDKSSFPWLPAFFKCLRTGYVACADLLNKLPLSNKTLIQLSYLDPSNQRSSDTTSALTTLAGKLPNVIPHECIGELDLELRQYTTDDAITLMDTDTEDDGFRIDKDWWSPIFKMEKNGKSKYPLLKKLVSALLTIFSGPLVEGTFNIMGDIIEEDRTRLTAFNYEALAMTKAYLAARDLKSTTMDISRDMISNVSKSWNSYSIFISSSPNSSCQPSSSAPSKFQQLPASSSTTSLPAMPQNTNHMPMPSSSTSTSPSLSTSLTRQPSPSSTGSPVSTSSNASSSDSNQQDILIVNIAQKRKQASLEGFFFKKPKQ